MFPLSNTSAELALGNISESGRSRPSRKQDSAAKLVAVRPSADVLRSTVVHAALQPPLLSPPVFVQTVFFSPLSHIVLLLRASSVVPERSAAVE